MQVSAEVLHALTTALNAAFTRGVGRVTPQYRSIATVIPSASKSNTYGWLQDFPGIKEWLTTRQLALLTQAGYSILNKTWESSVQVKREDIEDDQIGQYSIIAEQFGRNTTIFPDELSFELLCKGFDTLCWDGQYFFDTDHMVGATTVSNLVGDPATDKGEPWFLIDATHALLPIIYQERRAFNFTALDDLSSERVFLQNSFAYGTDGRSNVGFGFWQTCVGSKAPLNKANYEAAVSALMGIPDSNGKPLGMNPTLLVTGKNNRGAAKALIEAITADGGGSNIYYKDVDLLISPFVKNLSPAPAP
jgi:phage major head subunit gpT-like protein